MEIAFHIGAHCTDDGRLLKSLLLNRARLADHGVAVPGPSSYREILRDVIGKLQGRVADAQAQDAVLEAILEGDEPTRLVLHNENFVSMPAMSLGDGRLYPRAYKTEWLRNLFPDHQVSFHIGIRNPASFVPALWNSLGKSRPAFTEFLAGHDPELLTWSDTIARVRAVNPDSPISVWCNEDSPLIWTEMMRDVAGLDPLASLDGGFDMLRTIMSDEGMKRLLAYSSANPPQNEMMRRRVVAAFLDKYALEGAMEEELDLPGWDGALVDELTQGYEDDLYLIQAIPGVSVLTP